MFECGTSTGSKVQTKESRPTILTQDLANLRKHSYDIKICCLLASFNMKQLIRLCCYTMAFFTDYIRSFRMNIYRVTRNVLHQTYISQTVKVFSLLYMITRGLHDSTFAVESSGAVVEDKAKNKL